MRNTLFKRVLSLSFLLIFAFNLNIANAGCSINIKLKNNESNTVSVLWSKSKVKTKGGSWKKVGTNITSIDPGKTLVRNYFATFGCKLKRRYKILFRQGSNTWSEFYPSPTGWSTNQTVIIRAKM